MQSVKRKNFRIMKAEDINSVDDCERYLEGCLNDFEFGISTKSETMGYLIEYTLRIIEVTKLTKK